MKIHFHHRGEKSFSWKFMWNPWNPCSFVQKFSNISCKKHRYLINKLNQKEDTGKCRLPTKAEWGYACGNGYAVFVRNVSVSGSGQL
ncbi:hypothetical protein QUF72_08215 [Desulfobacterales bacterium HSG2]|nr:hypothetical protein [Desulfobacterales bacterium HSG2]